MHSTLCTFMLFGLKTAYALTPVFAPAPPPPDLAMPSPVPDPESDDEDRTWMIAVAAGVGGLGVISACMLGIHLMRRRANNLT